MHEVETARLRLRMFTTGDLDALALIFADLNVMEFMGKDGLPIPLGETAVALESIVRHWQTHGFGRWAVEDKEEGSLIGYAGIRSLEGKPELVYLLAKKYWGRGLATEAAGACLRYGFGEKKFDSILALSRPLNVRSRRVMEKLGMKFEKDANYFGIDVVQYVIRRQEYSNDDSFYLLRKILRDTPAE
ncbi:MAG TPA: GNAT family N-acetyltransferase [Pyrinomonadaceae bacterium]|jgi:ribosomal-protein-alanine N-acetyltransferase|nr:GNAT family N-acetyltransferase [Pyrinomonadaceae bacterium]